jgi:hypothetical protein
MSKSDVAPPGMDPAYYPPTVAMVSGLAIVTGAVAWEIVASTTLPGLRSLVIGCGLLTIGVALYLLLPRFADDPESRLGAGGLWALAGAGAFLGSLGFAESWDSLVFLARILGAVAWMVGLITAVPNNWRYLLGTLLLLWHFSAIFCAIVVVPPPNAPPPFLALQAYVRYFHPYLVATNLNNGYHFYAPEPGPCALLWYRVEWADGATHWGRIPDHPKMANHLERRRYGALATVVTQSMPTPGDRLEKLAEARLKAGEEKRIPLDPNFPVPVQYREPTPMVKLLLSSFARFIAKNTAHPTGGDAAVTGVKLYSVEYYNPPVEHFQAGRDPLDALLYIPHFMGDYLPDGRIKPEIYQAVQQASGPPVVTQDPFLYWRVPILREFPEAPPAPGVPAPADAPPPWTGEGKVLNFVRKHAGDSEEGPLP